MGIIDALILGILQGITEFLPISSSGHLVLGEYFLDLNVESLKSFDVVVHMGTLGAIILYFWKDIYGMIKALGRIITGKLDKKDPYGKLIGFIIIGTIPAVIVGFTAEDWIDSTFRDIKMVAGLMFILGIVYVFAEMAHKRNKGKSDVSKIHTALIIGVAQACALIPGISRSGSTIAAGLFQGVDRSKAARFSFLLGLPAIFGAGLLTAVKIPENGGLGVDIFPLLIGFFASFVFGILSVSLLMRFLKSHTLIVFSVYLIALGFGVFIS